MVTRCDTRPAVNGTMLGRESRKFMLGDITPSRYKKTVVDRVMSAPLGGQPARESSRRMNERRIAKHIAEIRKNRRRTEPRLKFIT
ncbi:hypothetical protein PCAR4_350029 [Paraburkholderia caribensis]|nr:hypothetical protein PCAR4_350029 [Paraburkholderia caribensis]